MILKELQKSKQHLTADELYGRVKKIMPRISLATVYRNLETLSGAGVIAKLEISGRQKRFDYDTENHDHIYCVQCQRVDNISLDKEAVFTSDMGQIPRFAGGLKTSVIYYTGSDIRLNENVIKIKDKGSAVEKLSALEGIEYSFKEDKEKRRMLGFSAQELQSVIPELVLKDENDMLAVDYTGMIPYLVEAIKEQQARINELEKMLIEMEN